jgi:hypothetical protein
VCFDVLVLLDLVLVAEGATNGAAERAVTETRRAGDPGPTAANFL